MQETKKAFGTPPNMLYHTPPPDAESRLVVRPSPDLMYTRCIYDVSDQPILFTAELPETYWSLSGFANNTGNFFTVNNQEMKSDTAKVLIKSEGMEHPEMEGVEVIVSPSDTGILLVRMFVPREEKLEELIKIQEKAELENVDM